MQGFSVFPSCFSHSSDRLLKIAFEGKKKKKKEGIMETEFSLMNKKKKFRVNV